jgi:hypothetical protein
MKLHLWKAVAGLLFGSVLGFTTSAQALSLLGQEPDPGVIISAGGLEWVWAAPCAPTEPSCGVVQLHHGFQIATEADWLSSFLSLSDILDAFTDDAGATICGSTYFSTAHDHCDLGDLQQGAAFNLPASLGGVFPGNPLLEAFLVRGEVPEPESLALLAIGLLGVSALRKRNKA